MSEKFDIPKGINFNESEASASFCMNSLLFNVWCYMKYLFQKLYHTQEFFIFVEDMIFFKEKTARASA